MENRANRYQKLSQDEQILHRPDTAIGSVAQLETTERVYDMTQQRFVTKQMIMSDGITNLFLEVLHNSADNKERSEQHGTQFTGITVQMDSTTVTVVNDGESIPVAIHPKWKTWIPATLFGDYNTSSNYNDQEDRKTLGRNGFGVKLVNTFSKQFCVDIVDQRTQKRYYQVWQNNKTVVGEPMIQNVQTSVGYVSVSWILDFQRFGMQSYNQNYLELFERHCIDIAYSMRTKVTFNGRVYDFTRDFGESKTSKASKISTECNKSYLSLFYDTKNTMVIYGEDYELILVDMPNCAQTISFVNGKCMSGGVHETCVYNELKSTIIPMINKTGEHSKQNTKEKVSPKFTVNVTNLKRHFGILINARLTNPTFKSQCKEYLTSPKINVSISENQFKKVLRWDFIKALKDDLLGKTMSVLKLDEIQGRRSRVNIKNAEDANFAGTAKSLECSLILTEGVSAAGYAVKWISCFPKGRNNYGIFPLRGKPLNVRNCDVHKMVVNKELLAVKKLLGIKQDYDYSTQEQINTLRYGSVLMMVDSDEDGGHILGLILNMFHHLWPDLLARNYIRYLKTPILRITMSGKNGESYNFYTKKEYDEWLLRCQHMSQETGQKMPKFTVKYYKGLGSSSTKEIKNDFGEMRLAEMTCRDFESVNSSINLAFNGKESKARKMWLTKENTLDPIEILPPRNVGNGITLEDLPIQKFIHEEMIKFSLADNKRSIPSFVDGLKMSQRKALWTAIKTMKTTSKAARITSLTGSVQEMMRYHHGEISMQGTIVGMAQGYIWKNNMPYFTEEGNYGTRNHNGKDSAAARYLFTRLQKWVRLVFVDDDDNLLELLEDENKIVEPRWLLPIIPMQLINGAQGIGTGFSTFIPKHKPLDIIDLLISMCINEHDLNDEQTIQDLANKTPVPWYRHFVGRISQGKYESSMKHVVRTENAQLRYYDAIKTNEDGTTNEVNYATEKMKAVNVIVDDGRTITFDGVYHVYNEGIHITELPIDMTTSWYSEFLKGLETDGIIKSFDNNCTESRVDFLVKGLNVVDKPVWSTLKLRSTKSVGNMVLLNDKDIPVKASSTVALMIEFFKFRLPWYAKRKIKIIEELTKKIACLDLEARLILLVVSGEIVVFKRPLDEIKGELSKHGIGYDVFKKLGIGRFVKEEIDRIRAEIEKLRQRVEETKSVTARQMWINDLERLKKELADVKQPSGESVNMLM